ncbi:CYTH domain-containing protein [Bacillus sp. FJAT-45350]|uniref:CYTH domain-containing protein n=1 Tax=Bacillus sp. FJAT-45350 TaxID=2011014 RepID=UPI000BB88520|nr:CYTH domain-containing protein [Bacillus sp. FJAT-45350]
MSQEIEIEAKNLVTEEDFRKLTTAFNVSETDFTNQDNHYFDTIDFSMKGKGAALRIRDKNDSSTLTLKQPHKDGLLETHQTLSKDERQNALDTGVLPEGEVINQLENLEVEYTHLQLLGTLSTSRAEIEYRNGLLVFDISHYLGVTDFEIEYEGQSKEVVEENFKTLLQQYQIPIKKTDNKIARFFTYKKSLEQNN